MKSANQSRKSSLGFEMRGRRRRRRRGRGRDYQWATVEANGGSGSHEYQLDAHKGERLLNCTTMGSTKTKPALLPRKGLSGGS